MKKISVGLAVILVLASGLLGNGLNLNGLGARAASMGGAFVGLANDFTAVFWNPAGLALLTNRTFGLTGNLLAPKSKYFLNSSFDMKTKNEYYPAGLIGYFQPIGGRVVVGLGAYTLSGLGADWNNTGFETALAYPTPPTFFTPPLENYVWRSFIGSITLAPSVAVKIAEGIFFGATFNINYGFFQTDQWGTSAVLPTKPPTLVNMGQQSLDIKGWGYGATFGFLIKPSDRMSFGLTYRTQSKLKLRGTMEFEDLGLAGTARFLGYEPRGRQPGLAGRRRRGQAAREPDRHLRPAVDQLGQAVDAELRFRRPPLGRCLGRGVLDGARLEEQAPDPRRPGIRRRRLCDQGRVLSRPRPRTGRDHERPHPEFHFQQLHGWVRLQEGRL